jgi:hypothetical protein
VAAVAAAAVIVIVVIMKTSLPIFREGKCKFLSKNQ